MNKGESEYSWLKTLVIGFGIASIGIALAVIGLILKSR